MNIFHKLKGYIFPRITKQAETDVDIEAVKNTYYVCLAVAILESFVLLVFLITKSHIFYDRAYDGLLCAPASCHMCSTYELLLYSIVYYNIPV